MVDVGIYLGYSPVRVPNFSIWWKHPMTWTAARATSQRARWKTYIQPCQWLVKLVRIGRFWWYLWPHSKCVVVQGIWTLQHVGSLFIYSIYMGFKRPGFDTFFLKQWRWRTWWFCDLCSGSSWCWSQGVSSASYPELPLGFGHSQICVTSLGFLELVQHYPRKNSCNMARETHSDHSVHGIK